MQRILHIVGKMDRAGAETMLMNLYRAIDHSEFQFDFVVFSDIPGDFDIEIKSLGGKIYRILEQNAVKRMFALKNLLKKHPEYKIIHAHTLYSIAFHIYAAKMANVPYRIAHSHSTRASSQSSKSIVTYLYQKLSKRMMNKYATNFISCGNDAAIFLFPYQNEVLILPNSINISEFVKISDKHQSYLNDEFEVDAAYLKIIQVGRLQKVKNHYFSIAIAQRLKERKIPFKMFFIGDGALYNETKNQIEFLNLSNDIFLLGLRSDIPKLMAGADVMLMPSLHEGFPVTLVESQTVGLPALISDNIPKEVDLGIKLVDFESLNSSKNTWVDKILSIVNREKINQEKRLKVLASKGFDINSSAKILSEFYNNLGVNK